MPTTFPGSPPMSSSIATLLESNAPLANEHLLLALAVGDGDAFAIHVLDAGGDERDRIPDQVDESVPLLLVRSRRLVWPDQLRRDVLMGHTGCYCRPQVRRPPVLVAAVCAVTEVRVEEDVRSRVPANAAHPRCRTHGLDGEIGRQRHGLAPSARLIVAYGFAGDEAEQKIVLTPTEPTGLHITAEMPAITNIRPINETTIIDPSAAGVQQRNQHGPK